MPTHNTSFIRGVFFACRGLVHMIVSQRNAKIHLACTAVVTSMAVYFELSRNEWLYLLVAIFFVLIAETFNTSIELAIDLIIKKRNIRAMYAKDVAAGAVLLAAGFALVVGYLLFYSRLVNLFLGGTQ